MRLVHRPDGHGSAAADALAQYEPSSHTMHTMAPASGWKLPDPHPSHDAASASTDTVPGAQSVGCCAPVLQKLPAGHAWHPSAASSPLSLPKRPAGHESAALLPSGQYTPSPHVSHAVAPAEPCS